VVCGLGMAQLSAAGRALGGKVVDWVGVYEHLGRASFRDVKTQVEDFRFKIGLPTFGITATLWRGRDRRFGGLCATARLV